MLTLLAIDTACAACSAAVWKDGAPAAGRRALMDRGQAEVLIPMVKEVMAASRVPFDALNLVAVTVGPGSYTGMRTGLAAARGIALAWGIPVLGVTTLAAVALAARHAAPQGTGSWPIVVALESRRAAIFAQHFGADLSPAGPPFAALPHTIAADLPDGGVLLAGDATGRVLAEGKPAATTQAVTVSAASQPDAVCVAEIAAAKWAAGNALPSELEAVPLYLSAPEAKRPAHGGRLRP